MHPKVEVQIDLELKKVQRDQEINKVLIAILVQSGRPRNMIFSKMKMHIFRNFYGKLLMLAVEILILGSKIMQQSSLPN